MRYFYRNILIFVSIFCFATMVIATTNDHRHSVANSSEFIPVLISIEDEFPSDVLLRLTENLPRKSKRDSIIPFLKNRLENNGRHFKTWLEIHENEGLVKNLRALWISQCYAAEIRFDQRDELVARFGSANIHFLNIGTELLNIDEFPDEYPNELDEISAGVQMIEAPLLWEQGFDGEGIVIALNGTGVNINHADLQNSIWRNRDEIPDNGLDDDRNGFIDDVHGWNFVEENGDVADVQGQGTQVAGILTGDGTGGNETGVAPAAKLMVLRIWAQETSSLTRNLESIQYALENGADLICGSISYRVDLGESDVAFRNASVALLASGMIMVNSIGSSGGMVEPPLAVSAPANCPPPWHHPGQTLQGGLSAMLGCGAVNLEGDWFPTSPEGPSEWFSDDYPPEYRDYRYNNGQDIGLLKPDLVAPTGVITTRNGGGYLTVTSTLFSTPHLAGATALLWHIHQQATPAQITEALKMSAIDGWLEGHDNRFGAGIINVNLAHEYLQHMMEYGSVRISVVNQVAEPIDRARISLNDGEVVLFTEQGVAVSDHILPGSYDVKVEKAFYDEITFDNYEVEIGVEDTLELTLSTPSYEITPASLDTLQHMNHPLAIEFHISNPEIEPLDLKMSLHLQDGGDWDVDEEVLLDARLENVEIRCFTYLENQIILSGSIQGQQPNFYILSENGTLRDSIPQPDEFLPDGAIAMTSGENGELYGGIGENIIQMNDDFEVLNIFPVQLGPIIGLAYSSEEERLYVSNGSATVFALDRDGERTGFKVFLSDVFKLAVHPDFPNGAALLGIAEDEQNNLAIYSSSLRGFRLGSVTSLEVPFDSIIDFDRIMDDEFPYTRFSVLHDSNQAGIYYRELISEYYSFTPTHQIPMGGDNWTLTLDLNSFNAGQLVDMEVQFDQVLTGFNFVRPVTIVVMEENPVHDEMSNLLPQVSSLGSPYPNPFNPIVSIPYQVSQNAYISLKIYNLIGEEVRTLVSTISNPGRFISYWDATGYAAGIYLAVLDIEGEFHSRKLILLH
ncbi:S8 family serine peptidase [bacterium]|nr:S8 family serine peptidase [bacterium]